MKVFLCFWGFFCFGYVFLISDLGKKPTIRTCKFFFFKEKKLCRAHDIICLLTNCHLKLKIAMFLSYSNIVKGVKCKPSTLIVVMKCFMTHSVQTFITILHRNNGF